MTKIEALAKYLDVKIEEIEEGVEHYGLDSFELGRKEYAIGTDTEADEACLEYIKDSAWSFKADFILGECGLDLSGADSLKSMQEKSCEGANDFILSLVEKTCGLEAFVKTAISVDGRGHYLSPYDGDENEEGEYYIYRIN